MTIMLFVVRGVNYWTRESRNRPSIGSRFILFPRNVQPFPETLGDSRVKLNFARNIVNTSILTARYEACRPKRHEKLPFNRVPLILALEILASFRGKTCFVSYDGT